MKPSARREGVLLDRLDAVGRLELLVAVAHEVTSILELDRLLERIGGLLRTFVPFEHFGIFLYDERRRELQWRFGIGYSAESRRRLERFSVDRGLVGRAVRTRTAVRVGDAAAEPDFLPARTETGEVPRSALAIPLVHHERLVGAMSLESLRPDAFSAEHERLLSALASLLAIAIENARLYEASRRDAATKQLLYDVSRETSSIELGPLLAKIADLVRGVIDYQLFAIYLYEPATDTLVLTYARGWSDESVERFGRVERGRGLFWKAIEERRSFIVGDLSEEVSYLPKRTPDGRRLASQINIPLIAKERPVGVMTLEGFEHFGFDEDDRWVLDALAHQMAVAIENARLVEALREREAKLAADLRLARTLQRSMLPEAPPTVPGLELAAAYHPAESLGGDFYDFLRLPGYRIGIVVADVAGKGVGAAMTMAASRGALRSAAEQDERPTAVLAAANRRLFHDIQSSVYVTLCYAVLDPVTGRLAYALGGHAPPLLVRADGAVRRLDRGGTVLGLFDGASFEEETIRLASGDLVCFFTDGVTDAFDEDDEMYGEERLARLVAMLRHLPASEIVHRIVEASREFAGARGQHDDMTVLVLKSV